MWAAEASECAADQGKFWEYHDRLFEMQAPQHNVGAFSKANLKGAAAALGLDSAAFGSCLDGDRYQAWIQQEAQAAKQRGAPGTPWVLVNGRPLQPTPATFDQLQSAIRQAAPSR